MIFLIILKSIILITHSKANLFASPEMNAESQMDVVAKNQTGLNTIQEYSHANILYIALFKIHPNEPIDAKTNQYGNRETGECSDEYIFCYLYVFGFIQFSESKN